MHVRLGRTPILAFARTGRMPGYTASKTGSSKEMKMMNAQNLPGLCHRGAAPRDKGWSPAGQLLTMVGWIPILGQIVLMGLRS